MTDVPLYPDVTQLAIPGFVFLLIIEIVMVRYRGARGRFETRDALTSLLMGVGSVAAGILFGFISYRLMMAAWEVRVFDLGHSIWVMIGAFIVDDLRYYWFHRIAHRCRWVWASHVVHHSSQHYNLTTALRQTWTGAFTGTVILSFPMILLGVHPHLLVFVYGFNLVYQFWIHTEVIDKMPNWFEAIFNTPSHHRVHHGRNPRYLDANYAGVLIIWDKLFGTFVPELEGEAVRYGLVRNLGTFNPLRVAVHEYAAILRDQLQSGLSLSDRFAYLFAPPGWSHKGSGETSDSLKAGFIERNPGEADSPGLIKKVR